MIGFSDLTYFFLLLLRIRFHLIIAFKFRLPPNFFLVFFIVFTDLNLSLVLNLQSCSIIPFLSPWTLSFLLHSLLLFHLFLLLILLCISTRLHDRNESVRCGWCVKWVKETGTEGCREPSPSFSISSALPLRSLRWATWMYSTPSSLFGSD